MKNDLIVNFQDKAGHSDIKGNWVSHLQIESSRLPWMKREVNLKPKTAPSCLSFTEQLL